MCFSDLGSVKRPLEGLVVLLGHFRSTLGVFGSFWWVLGRLLGAFGPSWAVLGASWVDFGGSLDRLGATFGVSWRALGPPWGPSLNIIKKINLFDSILAPFWYLFGGPGGSWNDFEGQGDEKGVKSGNVVSMHDSH